MSQLASLHPGSFHSAFDGPAYNAQGYPQTWQPHGNQAFAYPGQQRQYHDGASDLQQAPAGIMTQRQPAFTSPPSNNPYTTAPYTNSVPAQAPLQHPNVRQSVTPPQHLSPNAAGHSQSSSHTPPTKYPMAAPPLPQTPANQQQQHVSTANGSVTSASPTTPQSPGTQNREQQRIALLLSINKDLLEEVNRLQSIGQGGAISPQQALQLRNAGENDKMASDEYIQCLRRVQANLAYMMPKVQENKQNESKVLPGPAHMTPPAHMSQLKEKYDQLKEVFPEWPGLDHRMSQGAGGTSASSRPNPQGGSTNGVSTPTSTNTSATT